MMQDQIGTSPSSLLKADGDLEPNITKTMTRYSVKMLKKKPMHQKIHVSTKTRAMNHDICF